ncbi:MAG: Dabb family protein [Lachnospiraceae bacterium]
MIKHIVMWRFKDIVVEEQKIQLKLQMKEHLLGLVGKVPGLLDAEFVSNPMETSTHEMALITTFDTPEHLNEYKVHPAHVEVADTYVRPYTCERSCLDYSM